MRNVQGSSEKLAASAGAEPGKAVESRNAARAARPGRWRPRPRASVPCRRACASRARPAGFARTGRGALRIARAQEWVAGTRPSHRSRPRGSAGFLASYQSVTRPALCEIRAQARYGPSKTRPACRRTRARCTRGQVGPEPSVLSRRSGSRRSFQEPSWAHFGRRPVAGKRTPSEPRRGLGRPRAPRGKRRRKRRRRAAAQTGV